MTSRCSAYCCVTVSDLYGNDTIVNVTPEMLIEKIKEMAVKQITADTEATGNVGQYRLILINNIPRSLCDDKTAKQESLLEGDSTLLLKNRNNKQPMSSLVKDGVVSHEGPSLSSIARATEGLPSMSGPSTSGETSDMIGAATSSEQVEQTLRKVLLALLELSYKFMHFNEDQKSKREVEFESSDVKHLTDMGFSEVRAKRALLLNNMNTNLAMEWLLQHADDSSDDEQMETSGPPSVRQRFRTFKPNPTHLASLMDMGFNKDESIQALKINNNNLNSGCEWLLGDRKVDDSHEVKDEMLNPESELYKALVANPTIHIGLHDRKVLEALEDMVENPWRRNSWAYESAVGNVILQILKLYNKYSTSAPQTNP
ncbi:ubiquitin-associated domain-containing protein 1-like [Ciona intestinalis]